MTNTVTKTYLVGVIERTIAYYEVDAEDARTAAENWQDGEFHDRDDEVLECEGPCNVRVEQTDGTWVKLPPSEWEAEPPATGITPAPGELDIHALLAERRQIAHIWSIEDVQHLRPDLDDDQAWEVLQHVDHYKDCEYGITWLTLELAIKHLCDDPPETDTSEEA